LQKWLREVHSIHIIIHYDYSIIGGYIVIYIIKSIEPRFINQINKKSKYENYKTYEESLEKGLQEALKLIII
jgi:SNF family Na+-dependent transporter